MFSPHIFFLITPFVYFQYGPECLHLFLRSYSPYEHRGCFPVQTKAQLKGLALCAISLSQIWHSGSDNYHLFFIICSNTYLFHSHSFFVSIFSLHKPVYFRLRKRELPFCGHSEERTLPHISVQDKNLSKHFKMDQKSPKRCEASSALPHGYSGHIQSVIKWLP